MKKIVLLILVVVLVIGCAEEHKEVKPISVQGTNFMLGDEPFYFTGAFTFPTLTHLIYEERPNWKAEIDEYLDSLEKVDIKVTRFYAFGPYETRISGKEEPNWERLDYLMSEYEQRGIYVIFVLWDFWDYEPTGSIIKKYDYWEDERIKPLMEKMVKRYKNKKIIFAWELINEGDREGVIQDSYLEMYGWVNETATQIKSIDPDHLVSTGFSGEILREIYFDDSENYLQVKDRIIELYNLPNLDFLTFHAYGGDIDLMVDASFYDQEWKEKMEWYVKETINIQKIVGKPILHEEWGVQKQVGEPTRTEIYEFMLDLFREEKVSNIFNGWGDENQPHDLLIYTDDTSEVELIKEKIG